ncbi:MAG: calcium/sodium antiporter [Gammaproteobacteria bacterium]
MLLSCLFIIFGLALLVYGADVFVEGAASIARILGMSSLMIGLTVVGFATSAPEMIVGSIAAWNEKSAIAIGNALGSNITNISLVLAVSILLIPITVQSRTLRSEFALLFASIFIALFLLLDGSMDRLDGFVLLVCLVISMGWIVWIAKHVSKRDPLLKEYEGEFTEPESAGKASFKLVVGLTMLLIGADLLVRGAVDIAAHFGVSDLVIGLTIVAIGTSLPELAASIASLKKKEADIAIGNIIGSNMFNMLAVLGIPALIHPDKFEDAVLYRDFPVMISLTVLLALMLFATKKNKLLRIEGALLLACFFGYQYVLYVQSVPGA